MAHLNLYLPDDVASALREEANASGVSLSRFMLSLLPSHASREAWPPDFFEKRCGFLTENMEEPADAPPDPVEALELP